ncbi:MAG: hypothetical protein WBG81_01810 [Rhodanobacter sp.]
MKVLVAATVLLLAPLAASATCSPADFAIKDFKVGAMQASRLSLRGELVNNCAAASAAQIRIEAKDAAGKVLQSKQGWPAGTSNIAPGEKVNFDLGRMFRYQPNMQDYTVSVVDVRTW